MSSSKFRIGITILIIAVLAALGIVVKEKYREYHCPYEADINSAHPPMYVNIFTGQKILSGDVCMPFWWKDVSY